MSAVAGVLAGVFVTGVGLAVAAVWTFVPAITAATGGLNLIIPAVGAAVAVYITWKDEIDRFIGDTWYRMVTAFEEGYNWVAKFVPFMDTIAPSMNTAATATERLSDELAGHSLTTAFEKAQKKGEEFLDTVGTRFAMDMEASILALKSTTIQLSLQSVGTTNGIAFAEAFNAGYMGGPGGLMTVIPEHMVRAIEPSAIAPKFAESGLFQAGAFSKAFEGFGGSISQTLARALEGGGGFLGAVGSLGTQAGSRLGGFLSEKFSGTLSGLTGKIGGSLGGLLNGALGIAMPLIGPAMGAAATWIGKKLFGVLNKPSEAEKAARQSAEDFVKESKAQLTEGNNLR